MTRKMCTVYRGQFNKRGLAEAVRGREVPDNSFSLTVLGC